MPSPASTHPATPVSSPGISAPNPAPSPLMHPDDAAAFLCVSRRTLDRWRFDGTGPAFIKLGGAVRYRRADLDAFIAAGVVSSTAEGKALKGREGVPA